MVAMSSQDTQSSDDGIQKAEPVRPPIDPFLVQPAAETGTPAADGAPAARAEAPGSDSTVDDQPADPTGPVAAEHPEAEAEVTEHVATRKPNGKRVLAFGAAAALLVGVGAGAGALGASALESRSTTTAQSGGTFGGFSGSSGSSGSSDGSAPSFGNGSAPSFGNGSTPSFGGGSDGSGSDSSGTDGTPATAAQTKGVVTIMTKLGYQSAAAAGTGIILTSSGEILTNNHVIAGATAISVTDESTNRSYTATVVGTDKTQDVAVLQLKNASGLTTASLASTPAKVGDAVTAVGNAGGTGTLAAAEGSVTDVKQSITTESEGAADSEQLRGLIETDADIVSGDSGGPMLNSAGQVVGIDTAASSGVRDVTGYAIPISTALSIARTIESGTDTADITIGYPAFLGIEVAGDSGSTSGAVVGSVLSGTPAASTGLAEGDTITAVDGDAISSATDLTTRLHAAKPGSSVTITWTSTTGDQHTAKVALVAGPAD
jgi:S1-C subfamily serine protease